MSKTEAELESVKNHLNLLRAEFVKCQKRNLELESQVAARGGNVNADSLPARYVFNVKNHTTKIREKNL